jgi:hypothetical protein
MGMKKGGMAATLPVVWPQVTSLGRRRCQEGRDPWHVK